MLLKVAEIPADQDPEVSFMPVNQNQWYFNIYEIGQAYGGPEEGGWYYEYGIPVESVPLKTNPFILDESGEKILDENGYYERSEEAKKMIEFFENKGFDFINGKSGGNRFKTSPWQADEEDYQNAMRYHGPDDAAEVYQEGSKAMEEFGNEYPHLLDKMYMDQYTDYAYSFEEHPAKEYPTEKPYYQ